MICTQSLGKHLECLFLILNNKRGFYLNKTEKLFFSRTFFEKEGVEY